jgi:hypothetical protein
MKHRAFVLIGLLFAVHFAPHLARANFIPPPNSGPRTYSFGNPLGKDVAGTWKSADANGPDGLMPSEDSTNSGCLNGFSESHLDSLFGSNSSAQAGSVRSGNTKIERTKPIEKVEPRSEEDSYVPQSSPAVPRKSDGKRVMLVAFGSIALLAYRKFRRARASVPWRKPSFL